MFPNYYTFDTNISNYTLIEELKKSEIYCVQAKMPLFIMISIR